MLGCDLLQLFYNGNPSDEYYAGVRDQVTSKNAYLLSLLNSGVVVQSAYTELTNIDVDDAWKTVQTTFGGYLETANERILKMDSDCENNWIANSKINTRRMMQHVADYMPISSRTDYSG